MVLCIFRFLRHTSFIETSYHQVIEKLYSTIVHNNSIERKRFASQISSDVVASDCPELYVGGAGTQ
jgi:hypothetical protein